MGDELTCPVCGSEDMDSWPHKDGTQWRWRCACDACGHQVIEDERADAEATFK